MAIGLLSLALLFASGTTCDAQPAQRIELEPCTAYAVAAADFDADGWTDVAVLTSERRLHIFRNADGELVRAGESPSGVGAASAFLVVEAGDVDGDGAVDLVAGAFSGLEIAVLFGRGDSTFERPALILTNRRTRSFALGDFDGDSHLDIVAGTADSVALVRFGADRLPDVSFFPTGTGLPHALVPGDFDGDDRLDYVVWGRGGASSLAIRHGFGDGSFSDEIVPATQVSSQQAELAGVARDLDGDGRDEAILLRTDSAGDLLNEVWVTDLRDGRYEAAKVAVVPGAGLGVSPTVFAADVDPDGNEDIVGLTGDSGEVFLLRSRGEGNLELGDSCSLPLASDGLRCQSALSSVTDLDRADFDRDGRLDLVVAIPASGIEILSNGLGACVARVAPCFEPGVVADAASGRLARVGSFLGDGAEQLLVVDGGSARLLSAEGGAFVVQAAFDVPEIARGLDAGDLDGNGVDDFAVSDFAGDAVVVHLLAREGSIKDRFVLDAGLLPTDLVIVDFDGDATLDIAVALSGTDEVAIFPGLGDGRFGGPVKHAGGPGPGKLGAGDLNGDGIVDLVTVSAPSRSRISVIMGDPGGGFSEPVPAGVSIDARAIELADLDGDGRDEATIIGRGVAENATSVTIISNKDGETLVHPIESAKHPRGLVVADLNEDGLPEIVFVHAISPIVTVMRWFGDRSVLRTSIARSPLFQSDTESQLVYWDVDRDGARDLVVVGGKRPRLEVFRRCGAEPRFRRGDVDGDGTLQLTDPVRLLQSLFAGGEMLTCPDAADTNDDGGLNLSDAVLILTHLFGGGPAPPPPGTESCGADPSEDDLEVCTRACR